MNRRWTLAAIGTPIGLEGEGLGLASDEVSSIASDLATDNRGSVKISGPGSRAGKPGPNPGGPTDQLNEQLGDELEASGMRVTHGGQRGKEEYFPGPNGGKTGSNRADLTAEELVDPTNQPKQRVQTVDTTADGWPTKREMRNAGALIRRNRADGLFLIPKKPKR